MGHDQIVLAEGDAGPASVAEPESHDAVGEEDRLLLPAVAVNDVDDLGDLLLGQQTVQQRKRHGPVPRQNLRQQHAPRRGRHHLGHHFAGAVHGRNARPNLGVQRDRADLEGVMDLAQVGEHHAFADLALALGGEIVKAEHDVLGGHDDRLAAGRRENVVGGHHEDARFELRLQRQGHVHRHLVAVEVRVEGRANQRMKLDRLTLDEHRLERLNAQTVQRRRPVEKHRVLANHLFQDIPDLGALFFHHALGRLDGRGHAVELELGIDEGLEELQRHLLRQAALMQLELRAHHDDRAAGIVDALAEQVLAEPALLALQHVRQRLQRPLVGAGDHSPAAAVVEQGVDRLLQHALFVAHDDLWRAQLDQPLEPVVAIDDAAVQVVQVRGREAAAVERNQGPQLGWNDRNHVEHHPFRLGAGGEEGLDQLEALDELLALGLRVGLLQLDAQGRALLLHVEHAQHLLHGLGADHRSEGVLAEFVLGVEVFLFRQ